MQQKENIEYRARNVECRRKNFIIQNSLFDIRYSLRADGKRIIHELPTAEGLAKYLLAGRVGASGAAPVLRECIVVMQLSYFNRRERICRM
jgi:hypothetical protein